MPKHPKPGLTLGFTRIYLETRPTEPRLCAWAQASRGNLRARRPVIIELIGAPIWKTPEVLAVGASLGPSWGLVGVYMGAMEFIGIFLGALGLEGSPVDGALIHPKCGWFWPFRGSVLSKGKSVSQGGAR